MAHRQHMQHDQDLLARLHEACRPSSGRSSLNPPADEAGECLAETPMNGITRGTLGSTINCKAENA